MDGFDQTDERTFRVNFSGDGAERLKEIVREKLKEFMGDYTDDTLVEYVIVLLRNGRHKQEAQNELNVFLEEASASFVSWLWDHLSSDLHLYVQAQDPFEDEGAKSRPILDKKPEVHNDPKVVSDGGTHLHSDYDGERPATETRSRRNREWKGLMRDEAEPPPLRNIEIDYFHSEKKTHRRPGRSKRSRSPVSWAQRKRTRQDERQEMISVQPSTDAPHRLLQFAVRDAVGSLRSPSLKSESTGKRLQSVVATITEDSLDEQPIRTRSITRGSAHALAMKAAAEAAQDVINFRNSGNVFDRLGHAVDRIDATSRSSEFMRHSSLEDGVEYGEYLQTTEYHGEIEGDEAMMERKTGLASESTSENDEYEDMAPVPAPLKHRIIDSSQSVSSANKKDSFMVRYSVAQNVDEVVQRTRMKDQDQANNSRKIVNISVNVNTWKPPHYQSQAEVKEVKSWPVLQEGEVGPGKFSDQPVKGVSRVMAGNDNEIPKADIQKEALKNVPATSGSYSAVRQSDNAESRTIFVNNVHFAATKDMLSRHFNKFGEVLKVIIVTDAATGQPKGSAYIEFMRKEAAGLALSLDGTSFMSRVLKVVRRNAVQNEAAPVMGWPRVARARLARMPFPRGNPGGMRGRLPIKVGPRSLQWKRETSSNSSASVGGMGAGSVVNSVPSLTARSLTYVRPESK
ncbi:protein gar2-like isoform X2 [Aristolochia californica]|uniref:protein gar2-like isoform X2 n=1 Tax=Aristolochia californica TaxID=171875 RepID=UPI0035D8907E